MKANGKAPILNRIGRLAAALLAVWCFMGFARADAAIDSWSALQAAIDRAGAGEVIALTEDLTALEGDVTLNIPAGKRLVLDLNGYTLDRNRKVRDKNSGSVITVEAGAMLTLRDSVGTGVVTGGSHDNGGGILNRGTLIMEGGRITGNAALHDGGGLANNGTMVLMGGSVTGNVASVRGGGVFNQAKASLTVDDGIVFGNDAPEEADIGNEGRLTAIGATDGEARIEDMPVIRRFMAQLAVIPTVVLLLALLLAVRLDAYLSRERRRTMFIIIVLVFSLILQNILDNRLSAVGAYNALRVPVVIYGYAVRPVILALFLYIVQPGRRYRVAWALVILNAAVYLTAFFSDIAFHFTVVGHFKGGPLRQTCTVVSALQFAYLFYLTLWRFRPRERKESWIPILVTLIIAGAVVMDFTAIFDEPPISFLTIAIAISCVFYYVWLHLQFVREHEEALEAGQRIQIMMSQIQPHFLFNSLEVIRRVYRKEPEKADDALLKFERYLRGNMDSMAREEPIPFETELEHTRTYLQLERLRFPNELHIDYDLRCTDFLIPSLTLQPLVENAVRHGVRGKKSGEGTVTIATRDDGDRYEVAVTDDGDGFDPDAVPRDDHAHIGLRSVRERLNYAGAELRIETGPEGGTKAVIVIPKQEQRGGAKP